MLYGYFVVDLALNGSTEYLPTEGIKGVSVLLARYWELTSGCYFFFFFSFSLPLPLVTPGRSLFLSEDHYLYIVIFLLLSSRTTYLCERLYEEEISGGSAP